MKKIICAALAVIIIFSFAACQRRENIADTSLKDGEILLTGKITKVSGSLLILESENNKTSDKFSFGYDSNITVVEGRAYVVDYTADAFLGKEVSVICSELIQETYPAGLTDVRMIIIK